MSRMRTLNKNGDPSLQLLMTFVQYVLLITRFVLAVTSNDDVNIAVKVDQMEEHSC